MFCNPKVNVCNVEMTHGIIFKWCEKCLLILRNCLYYKHCISLMKLFFQKIHASSVVIRVITSYIPTQNTIAVRVAKKSIHVNPFETWSRTRCSYFGSFHVLLFKMYLTSSEISVSGLFRIQRIGAKRTKTTTDGLPGAPFTNMGYFNNMDKWSHAM